MQLQQVTAGTAPIPPRRIFFGSAVTIGVGSAVGGAVLLQSKINAQASMGSDELEAELHKQLQEGVKGMRGSKRSESARKVASTIRITAAHYRTKDLDTAFKRHLRSRIRREGKDAVLRAETDPQMLARELKAFGLTKPLVVGPTDYLLREKVLNELLAVGLTPFLINGAAQLERSSAQLDDQPLALVSARQYGCPEIINYVRAVELAALTACVFNPVLCAMFSGLYAGLLISLMASGC